MDPKKNVDFKTETKEVECIDLVSYSSEFASLLLLCALRRIYMQYDQSPAIE